MIVVVTEVHQLDLVLGADLDAPASDDNPSLLDRGEDMAENTATIVGIEALAAAQGIDFHKPLATSDTLQHAHGCIRARVAYYGEDRLFAPDIEAARRLVLDGDLGDSCRTQLADLALV